MRRIYEFRCEGCGEVYEQYVEESVTQCRCECGSSAKRLISIPRIALEGISGDFPTAHDQWVKKREEKLRQERKQNSEE